MVRLLTDSMEIELLLEVFLLQIHVSILDCYYVLCFEFKPDMAFAVWMEGIEVIWP